SRISQPPATGWRSASRGCGSSWPNRSVATRCCSTCWRSVRGRRKPGGEQPEPADRLREVCLVCPRSRSRLPGDGPLPHASRRPGGRGRIIVAFLAVRRSHTESPAMPDPCHGDEARRPVELARLRMAGLVVQEDRPLPEVFRRLCEIAADTLCV